MASMWPPKKNTAFTLCFTLYKNDGTVIANPGTLTRAVSVDGAAVDTTPVNAVTEEDTTYGQLSWVLDAAEMNGDWIWVYCKDDTAGCVPFTCTLYTTANTQDEIGTDVAAVHTHVGALTFTVANQVDVNVVDWKGAAAPAMTGDPFLDSSGVTELLTRIPDATAGANGGLVICGSNAAATFASLSVTGQLDAGNVLVDTTTVLTGTTTLTGAVSLGSTLGITGATTLASLSITGQLDAGNILVDTTTVLTGNVTLSGTLGTGAVTLSALTVTSALTTGSIVNNGVFTQTGTHTISALTVTNALTAGSNAIPWNAAWDAEVQSECDDAITANTLILDLPTTAEFETRTLVAADYTIVSDLGTVQTGDVYAKLPANFEHLSITDTTGLVDITQTAADKVWGTATRVLTAGTNLSFSTHSAADVKTALEAAGGTLALSKTILDKVDTMTVADGAVYQLTANALELAPTGGTAPTTDQIAAKILKTPANLLVTDTAGRVTVKNRSL